MKFKTEYAFYFFTISILIFLVAPVLLADGMFMDGVQYACVSNNLYQGLGTFWKPFLTHIWFMNGSQAFMEQPPLFYWLESRVFLLFGDSIYSERIFSLLMLGLNAWLIHKLWQLLFEKQEQIRRLGWLPILLWIITPICFWTFQNNMIEMVVSAFTLLSVYFAYKSINKEKSKYLWIALAALTLFLGFLTKGIVTLFPISVYLIFSVFNFSVFSFRKALKYTAFLMFFILLFFLGVCLLSDEAFVSIKFYLSERLLNRIQNTPTVDYRWWLLVDLFSELIPVLGLTFVVWIFSRKHIRSEKQYVSLGLFFLLMGVLGSLPLMLTLVQKKFYFMPSIAFFALGFSILIIKNVELVVNRIFKTDFHMCFVM